MWTLAFYLAMLAFFLPKKAKKVVAYISMGLTAFYFILWVLGWLFDFYIYIYDNNNYFDTLKVLI